MEFLLKQTVSGFQAAYSLINNGAVVSSAEISNNFTFGGAVKATSPLDGSLYHLLYKPLMNPAPSAVPYVIYDSNNQEVGRFSILGGGKGFKTYEYYKLEFLNNQYYIFEVGLGKDGIKYPIYCNDVQIALIEKDSVVYNNLDEYNIFAIDANAAFISYLSALYLDIVRYSNRGEVNKKGFQKYYVKTTLQELKNKYNPDFKNQLINR